MENEIWKPILGYEGYYEVSNLARVRSLDRIVSGCNSSTRVIKGKILSQKTNPNGYYCVGLYRDRKEDNRRVHRLVVEAFIPNPENKPCIDHINRNPKDNRIENLRWCTHKENCNNPNTREYARKTIYISSTYEKAKKTKAERNSKTREKPVYMYDLNGYFVRGFKSAAEAGRETGIIASEIVSLCLHYGERGRETIGGYIWSRERKDKIEPLKINKKYKKVYQYTPDGAFVREWESVKSACSFYGVRNVSRCARGAKDCLCAGFNWRFFKTNHL